MRLSHTLAVILLAADNVVAYQLEDRNGRRTAAPGYSGGSRKKRLAKNFARTMGRRMRRGR